MKSSVQALPAQLPADVRDRLWGAMASAMRSDAALTDRGMRAVVPIVLEQIQAGEKRTRDLVGMAVVAFFVAGLFVGGVAVAAVVAWWS